MRWECKEYRKSEKEGRVGAKVRVEETRSKSEWMKRTRNVLNEMTG